MKEAFGDSPPFYWSRTHSHLALMGGFAFDTGGDSSIPLPNTRYTLTPVGICFLAKHRPDLMPNITTDAINDKSKASPFAKALVLAQALWFCLQTITRLAMRMPISALELNTLAHVFFAFFCDTKSKVAPTVEADVFAVEENICLVIYRLKVQEDSLPSPPTRESKWGGEPNVRHIECHYPRQGAFNTERDVDFFGQRERRRSDEAFVAGSCLVGPDSIQRLP